MSTITELAKTLGLKTTKDSIDSTIKYKYPLGCAPLDILLGGGIPSGRLIEIYGKPSEGKSTTALEFTKAFSNYWRERGEEYFILWIESESVFDRLRAKYIGCDIERFLLYEASTVEDGFSIIEKTIIASREGKFKLFIVWDTIAATTTLNQKSSGELFSGGIAEKPRIINQALRGLIPVMGENDVTLILVNQVYSTIGHVAEVEPPGGFGIKFFSSIRLSTKLKEKIIVDDQMVAINTEIESVKNKIATPRQKVWIHIHGEKGFDSLNTLYNYCFQKKIVTVSGGWKKLKIDTPLHQLEVSFQSVEKHLRPKIKENPIILDYIEYKVTESKAATSPFMKVKLIEDLWRFEMQFHGKYLTALTEEEKELARIEEIEILNNETVDTSDEDKD